MNTSPFKNSEAVYVVILREPTARDQLTRWSNSSKSIQARVEDNRMYLYDHNSLGLFQVTWPGSWDNLVIWDPWTKRHIAI